MALSIQRVARGLSDVLSIFGGQTPKELEDRVAPGLELIQFYGLSHLRRVVQGNAALAEGGAVDIVSPGNEWWVVWSIHAELVKTATMTACHLRLEIGQGSVAGTVFAGAMGPFGATETGTVTTGFMLPYPRILPPTSIIRCAMGILGTDATANVAVAAVVGVLG